MRWERIPILGNNPVFCFEARRLWTRRMILWLLLVVVGLAVVSCGISWPIHRLLRSPSGPPIVWYLLLRVLSLVPAPLSHPDALGNAFSAPGWRWWGRAGYVVALVLGWVAHGAGRLILPAMGALSVAADRRDGRLESVLITRMSARQILVGKISVLVLPFLPLGLVAAVAGIPSAFVFYPPPASYALDQCELIIVLFAAATTGLCLGAIFRHAPVAVALSVLLAGMLLPPFVAQLGFLAAGQLAGEYPILRPPEYFTYASATWVILWAVLLAVLWLTTKHVLTRAPEWRIHAAAHSSLTTPTPGQTRSIAVIDPAGGSHVTVRAYNADPVRLRL